MARRHARYGSERPRRVAVFSLAALAVLGAAAWLAPTILVLTSLRDRPLEAALAGIAGSVSSGRARWAWFGPVEFHDVVLRDPAGRAVAIVPELVIDHGLVALALQPRALGTVRLVGPEVLVDVRPGGSSLEDLLAPWLAAASGAVPACTLEIVDGVIELVDSPRGDAWRLGDLFAAVTLDATGAVAGWTAGGRVRHAGRAAAEPVPAAAGTAEPAAGSAGAPRRIDRVTVAAGAAAAIARDGGFSLAATAPGGSAPRRVTVSARRLPLGISSLVATRFGGAYVADGLAEVRLDVEFGSDGPRVAGTVEAHGLALCRADTLAEVLTVDELEVPVELAVGDGRVTITKLAAISTLFRAEATGRIRLPGTATWDWLEGLAADDFAVAADVDLAAVARALAGGIVVRDDVRVTDGHLEIAAAARADGDERMLEVRVSAGHVAAEQSVVDEATGRQVERSLRWTEPFTAWLKARRGPGGGFRIDEGRLTSAALEATVAGTADAATAQWTLDCGALVSDMAEVVDLAGVTLAGTSRGRLEWARPTATGPTHVRLAADLEDFELVVPGRPPWRDEAVSIEGELTGRWADGAAMLEAAHAVVTSGDDRFEATLAGGVVVDSLRAGRNAVVRPAGGAPAATDLTMTGDLGRWHARLAPLLPAAVVEGVDLGGRVTAAVAATARGDAWEITRASAEVERLTLATAGRRISEPRLLASAAGVVRPAAGRIDLASAEVLTATVSVRTAGLSWRTGREEPGAGWRDRLRGTLQWQADAGRLERWIMAPEMCDRWPIAGRAWGTLALVDGADGLDIVVEATGSQLALAEATASAVTPRPLWTEPQATLTVEFAMPAGTADTVRIDRLALDSSTLAVTARGTAGGRPRGFALDGTMAYDWQQVSRLMAPWTGGVVQLAGGGGRPFAVRGRLADTTPPAPTPPTADTAALPLPADWAAAAQAGSGPVPQARVALPVVAAASRSSVIDLARTLTLDTSLAWQAGDLAGFRLDAGEIPLRVVEGQVAFGPFDVGLSGGRVRGAPWVTLAAEPRELVVPAGRVVERVAVDGPPARRLVSWLSPLVGHATHTSGLVTIDLAGARLPLADPFAGLAEGQAVFEALEVTPDAALAPLATLLAKLQALVDPRLALGDKPVLMRVRPDPVRLRLANRRLWHEGLVLDAGQFTVKSGGSVGADGTLAMVVEVALRADVAGQTPVVAQLVRTPLVIPLKGTVERPQFDARAIDMMLATIVENTAQAVIGDGIVRGLDALLGGQQAPATPQPAAGPLVLPAAP